MSHRYAREPELTWRDAVDHLRAIEDDRAQAIALLQLALGEGAAFLALANREHETPIDSDSEEMWGDFFETAEAKQALGFVLGSANAAFLKMNMEQKLQALSAVHEDVKDSEETNG